MAPRGSIEITPEMLEAGYEVIASSMTEPWANNAFLEWRNDVTYGGSDGEILYPLLQQIFLAMMQANPSRDSRLIPS